MHKNFELEIKRLMLKSICLKNFRNINLIEIPLLLKIKIRLLRKSNRNLNKIWIDIAKLGIKVDFMIIYLIIKKNIYQRIFIAYECIENKLYNFYLLLLYPTLK